MTDIPQGDDGEEVLSQKITYEHGTSTITIRAFDELEEAHRMGLIDVMALNQKRPPYTHRCPICGELTSVLKKNDGSN